MAANRRQMILAESARLFSECGLSATTIREIADAVGLNSGTLYHYFKSKDAIFSEILTVFLTDLVKGYDTVVAWGGTARERLTLMVRVSLEVADEHPYATEIYQNEYENLAAFPNYVEIAKLVESSHRAWYGVAEEGVREGEFNSGIDIFEFQRMMRECVFQSVRWHRGTLTADIETITATLTSVFLNGFAVARTEHADEPAPRSPTKERREQISAVDPVPDPRPDAVGQLRSELEALRSDVHAIRDVMEALSGQSHAINAPAGS